MRGACRITEATEDTEDTEKLPKHQALVEITGSVLQMSVTTGAMMLPDYS